MNIDKLHVKAPPADKPVTTVFTVKEQKQAEKVTREKVTTANNDLIDQVEKKCTPRYAGRFQPDSDSDQRCYCREEHSRSLRYPFANPKPRDIEPAQPNQETARTIRPANNQNCQAGRNSTHPPPIWPSIQPKARNNYIPALPIDGDGNTLNEEIVEQPPQFIDFVEVKRQRKFHKE